MSIIIPQKVSKRYIIPRQGNELHKHRDEWGFFHQKISMLQ